jgi:hypothetical protein
MHASKIILVSVEASAKVILSSRAAMVTVK